MKIFMTVSKKTDLATADLSKIIQEVKWVSVVAFGSTKEEVSQYLKSNRMDGISKIKILPFEISETDVIKLLQIFNANSSSNDVTRELKNIKCEPLKK